jgi:hypothetical protein
LRKLALLATVFSILLFANIASAQQGDAMLGFGTVMSPSSASSSLSTATIPETGGLYPTISGDVIFHRRIGFNAEVSWRGSQGLYGGCEGCQPYRPIIYDFNADFQPRLGRRLGADLMAGIGGQDTRFYGYTPTSGCVYFGACYSSDNKFLIHIGGGVRYYFWHHVFIRPEVHYYSIINQDAFSSGNILRVGGSLGYTIGPE